MIIVMQHAASAAELAAVVDKIHQAGLTEHISRGTERTIVGAVGDERRLTPDLFERMPGVERAIHVVKPYRIVSRESRPENTVVKVRARALTFPAPPPGRRARAFFARNDQNKHSARLFPRVKTPRISNYM